MNTANNQTETPDVITDEPRIIRSLNSNPDNVNDEENDKRKEQRNEVAEDLCDCCSPSYATHSSWSNVWCLFCCFNSGYDCGDCHCCSSDDNCCDDDCCTGCDW